MRMTMYRKHIVILLLLAFAGQSLASMQICCQSQSTPVQSHGNGVIAETTVHCNQNSETSDPPKHTPSVEKIAEQMSFSDFDSFDSDDCCADWECRIGGCSSSLSVVDANTLDFSRSLFQPFGADLSLSSLTTTPLFRPPISR